MGIWAYSLVRRCQHASEIKDAKYSSNTQTFSLQLFLNFSGFELCDRRIPVHSGSELCKIFRITHGNSV